LHDLAVGNVNRRSAFERAALSIAQRHEASLRRGQIPASGREILKLESPLAIGRGETIGAKLTRLCAHLCAAYRCAVGRHDAAANDRASSCLIAGCSIAGAGCWNARWQLPGTAPSTALTEPALASACARLAAALRDEHA